MNNYELIFAISDDQSEDEQKKILKSLTDTIEKNAGEVNQSDSLGKKTLAYEIAGKKAAFYWLVTFKSGPDLPKIISDQFRLSDQILRSMVTVKETVKKSKVKMKKKTVSKEPAFIR